MTRRHISDEEWAEVEKKLDRLFGPLHEYEAEAVWPEGSVTVPVFARTDAEALKTLDSVHMQWHFNRRLYPTSHFERTYCPHAEELVLWAPGRIEVARYRLVER